MFTRILSGTVSCDLTIVGSTYVDRQHHTWTFGASGLQFSNSNNPIPATWILTGGGKNSAYPMGWDDAGNGMVIVYYRQPLNTNTLQLSILNSNMVGMAAKGTGTARDANKTVVGNISPFGPWPTEILDWSLDLSGPLQAPTPFVGLTFRREVVGGRIITIPTKMQKTGLYKSYPGGSYGPDEMNSQNCIHSALWNCTIDVQ